MIGRNLLRATQSQGVLKVKEELRRARVVPSVQELIAAEGGNKPWIVLSRIFDEERLWCPRTQDSVQVEGNVTAFPHPKFELLLGENSYRGIVTSSFQYQKMLVKNPATRRTSFVPYPEFTSLPRVDCTSCESGFYMVHSQPTFDSPFNLYSSHTNEWRSCTSSLKQNMDLEHSLAEFLKSSWLRGEDESDESSFTIYSPVFDTWKVIPRPHPSRCKLHEYQGRLYSMVKVASLEGFWFQVFVYSEESSSWSSISERKPHKEPRSEFIIRMKGDGPYMLAFGETEYDEVTFLVVFDLDKFCWYEAEIPWLGYAVSYTPTQNPVPECDSDSEDVKS